MGKQSIIFLGSKPIGYHCLDYLIKEKENLQLNIDGVLCNESSTFNSTLSLKKLAQSHDIPILESLDEIKEVDFLFSVQFHQILPAATISKAKKIAINLHMAPLPEYRGCNQFSFAILDSKKEFGTTIHVLDSRIDHGDILFEKRFEIPANCWIKELYELTYQASLLLFQNSLADIIHGNYTRISQESLVKDRGTQLHYRSEINNIKQIDLDWEAEKIMRHIRATSMPGFEPPFTIIDNKKVYFTNKWM